MIEDQFNALREYPDICYLLVFFLVTPQATRETKNSLIENSAADADQHEILKVETVPSMLYSIYSH